LSTYAVVNRPTWSCAKPTELKTFVHQEFYGISLGKFVGHSNLHISKTTNFIFSQNNPPSQLHMPWCIDQLGHVQNPPNSKLSCTKTFMLYSFGDIWRPFQPSHLKNHEILFFHKKAHQAISSNSMVHRPSRRCAKLTKLKTFVHQEFYGIHLGTIIDHSNLHISKPTNFIFLQNNPPSHLAMSWCTDQLCHVQNPPNSKLSCTKTFMVFIWGRL